MNDDACVLPDRVHRFAIVVGCTSSTLKQIGQPGMHGGFFTAHHVFSMTQRASLRRGQASKVGIV